MSKRGARVARVVRNRDGKVMWPKPKPRVQALEDALVEARKIIVEVCGACSVPLPEATLERIDAALGKAPRLNP